MDYLACLPQPFISSKPLSLHLEDFSSHIKNWWSWWWAAWRWRDPPTNPTDFARYPWSHPICPSWTTPRHFWVTTVGIIIVISYRWTLMSLQSIWVWFHDLCAFLQFQTSSTLSTTWEIRMRIKPLPLLCFQILSAKSALWSYKERQFPGWDHHYLDNT